MLSFKGFTLFTALVSFALIALTALLVQGMIKAERDSLNLLSNIEEQAELQAIADLERADALNTFNFSLRFALEEYFTNPEQGGVLNIQGKNWSELKRHFAQVSSAGVRDAGGESRQFATFLTDQLKSSLQGTKQLGQNLIRFENNEQDTLEALTATLSESVEEDEFFEIVGDEACEMGDSQKCIGTFYITLDTTKLTDEQYEKLL